jgi:hypothetical protein
VVSVVTAPNSPAGALEGFVAISVQQAAIDADMVTTGRISVRILWGRSAVSGVLMLVWSGVFDSHGNVWTVPPSSSGSREHATSMLRDAGAALEAICRAISRAFCRAVVVDHRGLRDPAAVAY